MALRCGIRRISDKEISSIINAKNEEELNKVMPRGVIAYVKNALFGHKKSNVLQWLSKLSKYHSRGLSGDEKAKNYLAIYKAIGPKKAKENNPFFVWKIDENENENKYILKLMGSKTVFDFDTVESPIAIKDEKIKEAIKEIVY